MTGKKKSTPVNEPELFAEIDFDDAVHTSDQRRIYRRKPKTAVNLINQIISRRGIAAEKSNNQLQGIWDSIVPMEVANQTRVGTVKRRVLEITVGNSGLMQILGFSKDEYLTQLNHQLGNQDIKDIRFRIGRIC